MEEKLSTLRERVRLATLAVKAVQDRVPSSIVEVLAVLTAALGVQRIAVCTPVGNKRKLHWYACAGTDAHNVKPGDILSPAVYGGEDSPLWNNDSVEVPTEGIGWDIFIPISSVNSSGDTRFLGALALDDVTRERRFTEAEQAVLTEYVKLLGLILENRFVQNQDPLTGLQTRMAFEQDAHRMLGQCPAEERVALVMVDADHFKQVNDTFGHDVGDEVLQGLGALLLGRIRHTRDDKAYRVGGEELVVLLRVRGERAAEFIANRIREAVQAISPNFSKAEGYTGITVSIGVAVTVLGIEETIEELVKRADKALYAAKHGGRNQVVLATAPK